MNIHISIGCSHDSPFHIAKINSIKLLFIAMFCDCFYVFVQHHGKSSHSSQWNNKFIMICCCSSFSLSLSVHFSWLDAKQPWIKSPRSISVYSLYIRLIITIFDWKEWSPPKQDLSIAQREEIQRNIFFFALGRYNRCEWNYLIKPAPKPYKQPFTPHKSIIT